MTETRVDPALLAGNRKRLAGYEAWQVNLAWPRSRSTGPSARTR
jgi:hypothetical protein